MATTRSTPRDWAQSYIAEKAKIRTEFDQAAILLAGGLLQEINSIAPNATIDDLVQLLESTIAPGPSHHWIASPEQALIDETKKALDFYRNNFGLDFGGDVSITVQEDKKRGRAVEALHIRLTWNAVQSIAQKHFGRAQPVLLVTHFAAPGRYLLSTYVDGIDGYDLRDTRILQQTFREYWKSAKTWLELRYGLVE